MDRIIISAIKRDLQEKMVILVGPRQVGKTWIARHIAKGYKKALYLNYDDPLGRQQIKAVSWLPDTDLIIFDEIHKMQDWKSYLKGIYDTRLAHQHILITGSARMDTFRKGGDSMAGRYFIHRLLPITPAELKLTNSVILFEHLFKRGGFPEPFLASSEVSANRWRSLYQEGLIRYDVLDFERIHDINAMNILMQMLRQRVGSPLSIASLARDIGVSHPTIIKYIEILEALYIVFRVTPHSRSIDRAIKKEPKIYFYDTGLVIGDEGKQWENMTALSLLQWTYLKHDLEGKDISLHYVRTKDNREVDFCMVESGNILQFIEAKWSDDNIHPPLAYMSQKYNKPGVQLVRYCKREMQKNNLITIRNGVEYLEKLGEEFPL